MRRNHSIISISLNLLLVLALLAPSVIMARPLPDTLPVLTESEQAADLDSLPAGESELPEAGERQPISPTTLEESIVERPLETELESPAVLPGDSSTSAADPVPDPRLEAQAMQAAGEGLSSMFVENVGQFDSEARFQLRGTTAGTVYLADDGVWLTVLEPIPEAVRRCLGRQQEAQCTNSSVGDAPPSRRGVNVKFSFVGANPTPRIVGINPIDMNISYIFGDDSTEWRQNVPVYGGVRYENLYPGIDIEYLVTDGAWQTRLVAQPDADLSAVDLKLEGATSRGMKADGLLQLETAIGPATMPPLLPDFDEGEANSRVFSKPLFLEQRVEHLQSTGHDLEFSTFLGGSSYEDINDLVLGSDGVFVTGDTESTDFPTTSGAFDTTYNGGYDDVFVAKLNASGTVLEFATFLGGSERDEGYGIAIDGSENVYVTGSTYSSNFPTTSGAFDMSFDGHADAFIAKLNTSGSALEYATYLGGSGWDIALGLAIDSGGSAYVTGSTFSTDFPATSGAYDTSANGDLDIFVAKLNANGSGLEYATYLGGSDGDDIGDIVVDTSGNVYVAGNTDSANFPTTSGAFDTTFDGIDFSFYEGDGFAVKISEDGSALDYATFLGGDSAESIDNIAVDVSGNAYVTGGTFSSNFPHYSRSI